MKRDRVLQAAWFHLSLVLPKKGANIWLMQLHWATVLGALIVIFTLRQVFQDLFHPSSSGSLSDFLARRTFNLFRRNPRLFPNAGPISVVIVITVWALLLALGFSLVYWAVLPGNFTIKGGRASEGFCSMLYFSLEVLTTLGLGDYAPEPGYLRFLATAEALMGFGLITASVSSILLINPAVGRSRKLARRVSVFARSGQQAAPPPTESFLHSFVSDVVEARVDFVHFPMSYYFKAPDEEASLPAALMNLCKWAKAADDTNQKENKLAAMALQVALQDLADTIAEKFLKLTAADPETVFRAYAQDHDPAR
jgi:hypothetical protein